MSHSLSYPFSVDFGGMSSSPGLLVFTSRLQSSSLLSSTVLSFLPLPFLLAVSSVIMSLKSGYISCLLTFILVPTSPLAIWLIQKPDSLLYPSHQLLLLLYPSSTQWMENTRCFLTFLSAYIRKSLYLWLETTTGIWPLLTLPTAAPPNNCLKARSAKAAPLWWLCSCLVLLGSSSVVRAVPRVTSRHFSAQDSAKAKVLTWITAFVSSPWDSFCSSIPVSLLEPSYSSDIQCVLLT